MTPQEQQASDVMHRELGVVESVPHDPNVQDLAQTELGGGLWAWSNGKRVALGTPSVQLVSIDKAQLIQLEQFLVSIGWRTS